MPPSKPPVSGQRFQKRPSVKREPSFGAFYTTSYLTSHHPVIKRSASDTFLHEPLRRRCRLRQHRQNDTLRMVGGVPYNVVQDTSADTLSMWQMLSLTLCMAGVQFTWTVELAYGTPYLLSLGLAKEWTALVWLAGPLSGLIIQPLIGALSDRCTLSLGRRRPFILMGGAFVCLSMVSIAFATEIAQLTAKENYREMTALGIAVFAFYTLDFSLNAVQASCRALIVDKPPLVQQQQANAWAARLSNLAMVVGYFTGFMNLVRMLPFLGDTQIKVFCMIAIAVFCITIGVTCFTQHEIPRQKPGDRDDHTEDEEDSSHWYDTFSYIWHAVRHLPDPIQRLCNVQFFAWLGWFPFLFYSTTWVSDLYFRKHPLDQDDPNEWAKGTRAGSFALLLHAIVSVISGIILPWLIERRFMSMKTIQSLSILLFSCVTLSTPWVRHVSSATALLTIVGISWSVVLWVPFALIGQYVMVANMDEDEIEDSEVSTRTSRNQVASASTYGATDASSGTGHAEVVIHPDEDEINTDEEEEEERELLDAGMVLGVHNMYVVFPQFAVALIASLIFRLVSWAEDHDGGAKKAPTSVAWVLFFGGMMGLVATLLSRRLVEVNPKNMRDIKVWQMAYPVNDASDRLSI